MTVIETGGLPCPKCNSAHSKVVDSRIFTKNCLSVLREQGVSLPCRRRRHECSKGHRFTTYESIFRQPITLEEELESLRLLYLELLERL